MKKTYHHFIIQELNGNSSFTERINVPFTPKMVKVNYVKYDADPAETGISLIRCPQLIRTGYLTSFIDGQETGSGSFEVGFSVNNEITFEILTPAKVLDTGRNGTLIIDLEFWGE